MPRATSPILPGPLLQIHTTLCGYNILHLAGIGGSKGQLLMPKIPYALSQPTQPEIVDMAVHRCISKMKKKSKVNCNHHGKSSPLSSTHSTVNQYDSQEYSGWVATDVLGPFAASEGNTRYASLFIDLQTCRLWIYPLQS